MSHRENFNAEMAYERSARTSQRHGANKLLPKQPVSPPPPALLRGSVAQEQMPQAEGHAPSSSWLPSLTLNASGKASAPSSSWLPMPQAEPCPKRAMPSVSQ